jgi:hypothetical protein
MGEMVLYSYNLIGIRSTSLLQEHFEAARMATNLVLADWSNKGVNLWQVQFFTVPLVQGTASYSVSATLVNILDLYLTVSTTNRYITPVSRTEFASFPNPTQQGFPTCYWHWRTLTPTVNFYPTPDGNQSAFNYYALVQIQDAAFTNGQTPDIPYLWTKALADAISVELATIWAPDKLSVVQPRADKSYAAASATGTEIAQMYISPTLSGYWRT